MPSPAGLTVDEASVPGDGEGRSWLGVVTRTGVEIARDGLLGIGGDGRDALEDVEKLDDALLRVLFLGGTGGRGALEVRGVMLV